MDVLPSYSEATTGPDWLALVRSYVPASHWARCCLVSRRFYDHFASFLWQDPLVIIRLLGLHPNDDLAWYRRFIQKYVNSSRVKTRCMVQCLDFRKFALSASGLYSTEASERAISESFKNLPQLFPRLKCLLLNRHPQLDPSSLSAATLGNSEPLKLLDLGHCCQELSPTFFTSPLFRSLVYLDVSYIPGSLRTAMQSSLNPEYLPELRILKAKGREVDDGTAQLLGQMFRFQFWSLDLSDNNLTDEGIERLRVYCFFTISFNHPRHFEVEGKLSLPRAVGTHRYGLFYFIEESRHSATFTHPERCLADAPSYFQRVDHTDTQDWHTTRWDGTRLLKPDNASAIKATLLEAPIFTNSAPVTSATTNIRVSHDGLTHIRLNENAVTREGLERFLRLSSGRIENLECDKCIHNHPDLLKARSRLPMRVEGVLGLSHLFRPVVSSSLRSLRIHHSLVTQVPTVQVDGLPIATTLRLSEDIFHKNVRRIYPQGFTVDTNPRITSLTLTNIPARSSGPVIERLISFLKAASAQEIVIKQTRTQFRGRHQTTLRGLRHLRLELEADFSDGDDSLSIGRDVDYDQLLDPSDESFSTDSFSFFGSESKAARSISTRTAPRRGTTSSTSSIGPEDFSHWTSGRLKSFPYDHYESEFLSYQVDVSDSSTGNVFSIPVWIGTGTIGPHAAVNEYMWNLQDPNLQDNVGPATPGHVAAGVPAMTYIFYDAWDAMLFPKDIPMAVKNCSPNPLQDVAAAIKAYRVKTKRTSEHWSGQIELVRTEASSRYQASEFWR
ncbi:hypothetical protein F5Y16DRAFT_338954 [Xylariaceae sp. FL0255]|nr:hypothetical protein F5Y16DRAFT_338954 [Xylariaceae sp. FL0255]